MEWQVRKWEFLKEMTQNLSLFIVFIQNAYTDFCSVQREDKKGGFEVHGGEISEQHSILNGHFYHTSPPCVHPTFPSLILVPMICLLCWIMSIRMSHSSMSFPSWRDAFTWEPNAPSVRWTKGLTDRWKRGVMFIGSRSCQPEMPDFPQINASRPPERRHVPEEDQTFVDVLPLASLILK